MDALQNGLWSGILATSSMTTAMFATEQIHPAPLPPAHLTDDLVHPIEPNNSDRRADMTMLNHFVFGIAMATVYSTLQRKSKVTNPVQGISMGMAFGLCVWATSYLGWIPAAGLRPSAQNLPRSTNLKMVAAHLIWGASLGFCEMTLRNSNKILDASQKSILLS